MTNLVFGPVPSRRLGHSLGINNIPYKHCSYACVYCQLKRTPSLEIKPADFYEVEELVSACRNAIARCKETDTPIDYLTLVSDGEPTLDRNLGSIILSLKTFALPVAVISNGSLLWQKNISKALEHADWVSLKVDSIEEEIWRKINRPHGHLNLTHILSSMLEFSKHYRGKLVTETMLVRGLNDFESQLNGLGEFLSKMQPATSYLSIPTRPPAEAWVNPPDAQTINQAYHILHDWIPHVECLIGFEGDEFSSIGNPVEDLLSITSVHPMRKSAVEQFIERAGLSWQIVEDLVAAKKIVPVDYKNEIYYLRNFLPH